MRCQFCGWKNPESKTTCEKCNQPLQVADNLGKSTVRENGTASSGTDRPTQMNDSFNPKATVREDNPTAGSGAELCPNCGYQLDGESVCPVCGTSREEVDTHKAGEGSEFKKTVRPNHNHRFNNETEDTGSAFSLVKITDSGEASVSISFNAEEVELNRGNTDPANQTITSRIQAGVRKEGDKWFIEDKSEYHSTFVQASRPAELRDGDMILLGDQLFRFEAK